MSPTTKARIFAALSLIPATTLLNTNLSYLLHGTSRGFLAVASAWVVMAWCAAILVAIIGVLLLKAWARKPLIVLLWVYIAYYGITFGFVVLSFSPLFVTLLAFSLAVPALCVWGLSRPEVRSAFGRRVA